MHEMLSVVSAKVTNIPDNVVFDDCNVLQKRQ